METKHVPEYFSFFKSFEEYQQSRIKFVIGDKLNGRELRRVIQSLNSSNTPHRKILGSLYLNVPDDQVGKVKSILTQSVQNRKILIDTYQFTKSLPLDINCYVFDSSEDLPILSPKLGESFLHQIISNFIWYSFDKTSNCYELNDEKKAKKIFYKPRIRKEIYKEIGDLEDIIADQFCLIKALFNYSHIKTEEVFEISEEKLKKSIKRLNNLELILRKYHE